jgi:hypothetical protein
MPKTKTVLIPRRPALPRVLTGIALRFGRWFSPELFGGCGAGQRVMIAPHALDRYLRRIRLGQADLELCLEHDGDQVLATEEDDCFSLEPSSGGSVLLLRLQTDCAVGRRAYREIKASGCADLSVTLTGVHAYSLSPGTVVVVEAGCPEVAVVSRGACPGCRWQF